MKNDYEKDLSEGKTYYPNKSVNHNQPLKHENVILKDVKVGNSKKSGSEALKRPESEEKKQSKGQNEERGNKEINEEVPNIKPTISTNKSKQLL